MMLHNIHVSTILALYLFIIHPCIFFILHQVVRKPFKFINNGLQTNESLVNESNFPSFLSLCVFILGHRLGVSKQFLYKYHYQCILIFSVIWLGMIRVKCNSFDTDMGIQIM